MSTGHKINLLTNRGSDLHSETTIGKVSARRIQCNLVNLLWSNNSGVILCNFLKNRTQKIYQPQLGVSRRDLSDGGLGSFVTIVVRWQIDLEYTRMARATKYKFTGLL